MKILIIDNHIDPPDKPHEFLGKSFRRYLGGQSLVRRGPENDVPLNPTEFTHIIVSGSKTSCLDTSPWVHDLMEFLRKAVEQKVPVLGVCFGHQILARAYGGEETVRKSPTPEFGWTEIRQKKGNELLEGLPQKFFSYSSHFEEVCKLPPRFTATAESDRCPIQAYVIEAAPAFGIQFHPEVNEEEGSERDRKRNWQSSGARDSSSVYMEEVALTIFKNFLKCKP